MAQAKAANNDLIIGQHTAMPFDLRMCVWNKENERFTDMVVVQSLAHKAFQESRYQ